jgi:hypothetical protein
MFFFKEEIENFNNFVHAFIDNFFVKENNMGTSKFIWQNVIKF